ncbi:hypothetical protein CBS101457_004136 [Exobasidium rhododendri]|nr:hypothetical protein CBS101457_004136 [Exobasidium rhododendri]
MAMKPEHFSSVVLVLGTAFFIRSAYTLLTLPDTSRSLNSSSADSPKAASIATKLVSQSAVSNVTYTATIEDCDNSSSDLRKRPKLRAGALLKLIDVAAGVAARRHAGTSCVTISVDAVLFLKPIHLGDLIHLSASVNRAWGTSMEIGVKVMKSDEHSLTQEYVSHSYLTFVAISHGQKATRKASPSSISRFWNYLTMDAGEGETLRPASKPSLARVQTSTRLEARRHLLAGRRRVKRIEDTKKGEARDGVSIDVKKQFQKEVLRMLKESDAKDHDSSRFGETSGVVQERRLQSMEIEYLIRALIAQEDGITFKDGKVVVNIPGDEPFSHPEAEIRRIAGVLGLRLPGDNDFQTGRRLSIDFFAPVGASTSPSSPIMERTPSVSFPKRVDVASTLTKTMHLVFPQHTNSHSIIFGGNTMSWSEDVAIMSCRSIAVTGDRQGQKSRWKTVAMDGLEFNVKVAVGELMIFSAFVVKIYGKSCEVYVMAQAEGRKGQRRFTNDVLFTLALDNEEGSDSRIASTIVMPPQSAMESFADASNVRRQQRLELKALLTRLYD